MGTTAAGWRAGPGDKAAILADLTAPQRQAVLSESSPLCILAAAGSGKTRVLTRRLAFRLATGQAQADHLLALTFTRKAAAELGDRLRALGIRDHVTAGTFHGVASAELRRWWSDRGRSAPRLLSAPGRLIGPLAAGQPELRELPVSELTAHLAWAQARLIRPEQFEAAARAASRPVPVPAGELATLLARYQEEKRRRRLVDFDDLLLRCAEALDQDPVFARATHWRWREIFVDEFQDVNPLEHRVLLAWMGPGASLTVVGDPNQAVYGWNGADPRLLDDLPIRWPSTEVVRLGENHRCSPQVVAAGAAVLGDAGGPLRSAGPDGPEPTVRAYPSELAEAAGVAVELQEAHACGLPWSKMAVLVRTNAQAVPLREALEAAGIPCRTVGAGFLAHPAVAEVLEDLRRRSHLPVATAAADLASAAQEATWPPDRSWRDKERSGPEPDPPAGLSGHAQRGGTVRAPGRSRDHANALTSALETLTGLARELERQDPRATVGRFLAWLPTVAGREPATEGTPGDAVTVSSFHRSKGLEWTAVWICGLERGLVPIRGATNAEAEAEERRLLYVAVTRAEREVHCSWARSRGPAGHAAAREPSPWLAAIGRQSPGGSAPSRQAAASWRDRLVSQGEALRRRPVAGETPWPRSAPDSRTSLVAARIDRWRAAQARALGVSPQTVLSDRSLAALSTACPATPDQLDGIPGLGPVRTARIGETLVSLITETG